MQYEQPHREWPDDVADATFEETKPILQSKTVVTSILLAGFGVATSLGVLPKSLNNPRTVGAVVTVGGFLAGLFRKKATKKI